jgi:hypothetical protein
LYVDATSMVFKETICMISEQCLNLSEIIVIIGIILDLSRKCVLIKGTVQRDLRGVKSGINR